MNRNLLRDLSAALRGARKLVVLTVLSRMLCSVRLAYMPLAEVPAGIAI